MPPGGDLKFEDFTISCATHDNVINIRRSSCVDDVIRLLLRHNGDAWSVVDSGRLDLLVYIKVGRLI